jgi:hypothetical protein
VEGGYARLPKVHDIVSTFLFMIFLVSGERSALARGSNPTIKNKKTENALNGLK